MFTTHVPQPTPDIRKSLLSPARRRLIELMRQAHFGRIENLTIRNRQPVVEDGLVVVRTRKLGVAGANTPRQAMADSDMLRQAVIDLFNQFDALQEGIIRRIDIIHGMPVTVEIAQTLRVEPVTPTTRD